MTKVTPSPATTATPGTDLTGRVLAARFWRRWLSKYKWPIAAGIALTILTAAATAAYPKLIQMTFDRLEALARGEGGVEFIYYMAAFAIAATLLKGVTYYLQVIVTSRVIMRVIAEVQNALFAHLVHADLGRLMGESSGKLITRFTNDVNTLRTSLNKIITNGLQDSFMAVALIGVMIHLDWLLALIVLVVFPVSFYPIVQIGKRLRRLSKNTQSHMGDMTSVLYESFTGARMVKAYGLEAYEQKRAANSFERMYRLWMKNVYHKARLEPLLEIVGGVAVAGVIAFSGWRIASGTGTVGSLIGFVGALAFLSQNIRKLGNLNAVSQEGMAAVQRIFDILDEAPAIRDAPDARLLKVTQGEVALKKVSFAYPSAPLPAVPEPGEEDVRALDDVSLTVPGGHTVALVGRSGAGKSTVFNVIPRFFEIESGAITIDGQDIREVTLESLRRAMALVSQDVTIFNDTVRANIAFGRLEANDEEIEAAAKAAAAHDFIMRLPDGYDTVVGDRGTKLSGGERQRVALARAVLKDAPILLLDEATSALDSESERLVQQSLEKLSQGRTTLVIAHRLATVRKAHMIAVIDRGKIVETGTHEELLAKNGLYTQLSRLQLLDDAHAHETAAAGR